MLAGPLSLIIPWPYKLLAVAGLVVGVGAWAYFEGRGDVRKLWDAEVAGYRVAAAQTNAREAEKVRQWAARVSAIERGVHARLRDADRRFGGELERLRGAYAGRDRVREPAAVAGECVGAGALGPSAAELLGAGERLAEIIRDADRDRAALSACVEAPR